MLIINLINCPNFGGIYTLLTANLDFAEQLFTLHSSLSENFGYSKSNYIGSLTQKNAEFSTFEEYYMGSRLEPQLRMAYDQGYFDNHDIADHFSKVLPLHIPKEKPTLIHGDLWSGNYIISTDDKCYLIDPSISYSHREMDIAMTVSYTHLTLPTTPYV